MTNANAGDLYAPDYAPYSNAASNYERPIDRERYNGAAPPPVYGRVEVGEGTCRVFHERRVGSYGRETIHRIRMCDEGPAYSSPNGVVVAPEYEYRPRSYYERSGYDSYPRPPAAIGHGYHK